MKFFLLVAVLPWLEVDPTTGHQVRLKRSLSCRVGSTAACRWSCRLRGYISGQCVETLGAKSVCLCNQPASGKVLFEYLMGKLAKRYPDMAKVVDTVDKMFVRQQSNLTESDGKWRPLPLLVGVLYKVEERRDRIVTSLGNLFRGVVRQDVSQVLGYFWHMLDLAETNLRPGITEVEQEEVAAFLKQGSLKYAASLNLSSDQVPWVWSDELDREGSHLLDSHTPDHLVTVDPGQKLVVLTILGTRVFPAPQPLDIMMDLSATTTSFLGGRAHTGMVVGARNLVKVALPRAGAELLKHPDFSLLIIGYSLGAGLAQLVTLDLETGSSRDLIPSNTKVTTICYGSPPVFTSKELPVLDNVFLVQNNKDGISGASLRNFADVFRKTEAIERLNLRRRDLFRMMFSGEDWKQDEVNKDDDLELLKHENHTISEGVEWISFEEIVDDTSIKTDYKELIEEEADEESLWTEVNKAVASVTPRNRTDEEPHLYHLGQTFLVVTRDKGNIGLKVRNYQGSQGISAFSNQLSFSPTMFDDHMPWGYNKLFEGVGEIGASRNSSINILQTLVKKQKGFRYKLKNKWNVFKSNAKHLFKNLG